MARNRDSGESLRWLEEALLEEEDGSEADYEEEYEEEPEVPSPGYFRSRQEFDENAAVRPRQNRKVGKLLLLLLLEIAAIAAIVRWWIQWW